MQLAEYVRMAAIMVYSELHSSAEPADDSQPSIH